MAAIWISASDFQGATHIVDFDEDGLAYTKAEPDNAITRLQKKIDSGETKLPYDDKFGYLPALLKELNLPLSSQMLVFSKTSLQRERISPSNPRAIYFNDDTYLGFIPGAPLIEISAADSKLGGVFFSLEQKPGERPKFKRNDQCLECHASSKTMGVPGHLVRSFATDEDGVVDLASGTSQVNHRTPFEDRWGGWYVTGTHGTQPHRGNLFGKAALDKHEKDPAFGGNRTDLSEFFQTNKFESAQSDIVALMVLEHQTHMHNFITRLNYEAAMNLKTYGHVNYMRAMIEGFLKYLLFTEEAELTAGVKGSSPFTKEFEALGPKDSKGRSLRQFDLESRMFKYPCSFLIYSEAFNALPELLKEKIYDRLYAILDGETGGGAFETLSSRDRRNIREILEETKPDIRQYWEQKSKLTSQDAAPSKAGS